MTNKKILFGIVCMLSLMSAKAHCIWIETPPAGTAGQRHEARIYYGEYVQGLHESLDGNFRDMKDLTVWLLVPGKQKVSLPLQEKGDHFEVYFTPDQDGVYTLQLENTHIKLYDTRGSMGVLKPAFYATATVEVGHGATSLAAVAIDNPVNVGSLPAKKYSVNGTVTVAASFNGKPIGKSTITVFSPAGWSKELTADEKGIASFTPEWKGRYIVEVIYFDKTPGTAADGAPYQVTRNVATGNIMVQ